MNQQNIKKVEELNKRINNLDHVFSVIGRIRLIVSVSGIGILFSQPAFADFQFMIPRWVPCCGIVPE